MPKIKIGYMYHEFWRRYHNLRYSKHRRRASQHLAKRGRATTDLLGNPITVRRES